MSWKSSARLRTVSQGELLTWGNRRLVQAGVGAHEGRLLLEWALDTDSLLKVPSEVGIRAAERFRSAIAQRCKHFPLQHIMGKMHFRHLELQAGPGVFSVRPETEYLVEIAEQYIHETRDSTSERFRIADLCAGSGAIGLSLATEVPNVSVQAIELSPIAAAYAMRNYSRYLSSVAQGSNYEVEIGDAVEAFTGMEGNFDLVVTNPPYVPGQPPVQPEVLYDPEMALYGGGEDGMVIPRGLIVRSAKLLRQGSSVDDSQKNATGCLLMEHDESQADSLVNFALDHGFTSAETIVDLVGRPRFLQAKISNS